MQIYNSLTNTANSLTIYYPQLFKELSYIKDSIQKFRYKRSKTDIIMQIYNSLTILHPQLFKELFKDSIKIKIQKEQS